MAGVFQELDIRSLIALDEEEIDAERTEGEEEPNAIVNGYLAAQLGAARHDRRRRRRRIRVAFVAMASVLLAGVAVVLVGRGAVLDVFGSRTVGDEAPESEARGSELWKVFGVPVLEPGTTGTSTARTTTTKTATTSTATTTSTVTTSTTVTSTSATSSTTTSSTTTETRTETSSTTSTTSSSTSRYPQEANHVDDQPLCWDEGTAMPDGPNQKTQYMYRAQSDLEYPLENINAADLLGVLWYLHHEIAYTGCPLPRKNLISRIMRFKVTYIRPPAEQKTQWMTGPFRPFDSGSCGPTCDKELDKLGHPVGCQAGKYGSYTTYWYSLPGPCPQKQFKKKDKQCIEEYPSSRCDCSQQLGDGNCTFRLQQAGEIRLNELVGIDDFSDFCENGGKEYDRDADKGVNMTFWDGYEDDEKIMERVQAAQNLFAKQYPNMPLDLGRPGCAAHYLRERY